MVIKQYWIQEGKIFLLVVSKGSISLRSNEKDKAGKDLVKRVRFDLGFTIILSCSFAILYILLFF
jgi:hypothetical protein